MWSDNQAGGVLSAKGIKTTTANAAVGIEKVARLKGSVAGQYLQKYMQLLCISSVILQCLGMYDICTCSETSDSRPTSYLLLFNVQDLLKTILAGKT